MSATCDGAGELPECPRRAFYAIRLPVEAFRAGLADAARPIWPPTDLDLMRARRHAAVLAGYRLGKDVAALQGTNGVTACRGLAAVAGDWADRSPAPGRAALFDCALDLPGGPPLGQACQQAGITPMTTAETPGEGRYHATLAVERALAIALICARHQGRYQWTGALDTRTMMTDSAWDCLPWPETAAPATSAVPATAAPGAIPVPAAAHGQRR